MPSQTKTENVTLSRKATASAVQHWNEVAYHSSRSTTPKNTAGYHKIVTEGGILPVNPYNVTVSESTLSPGRLDFETTSGIPPVTNPGWDEGRLGLTSFYPAMSSAMQTKARNEALERLHQRIRSQEMSLGETIGELRSTQGTARAALERIVSAAQHIRGHQFLAAARILHMGFVPFGVSTNFPFARNWLAYRYGVMPIVYEVLGALKLFENNYSDKSIVRAVGRSEAFNDSQIGGVGRGYFSGFAIARSGACSTSYRVEYGCLFEVSNPKVATLAQTGITGMAATAVELMRYSMIVNWFANIYDYMRQFSTLDGKKYLGGWRTVVTERQYHCQTGAVIYDGPNPRTTRVKGSQPATLVTRSYAMARISQPSLAPVPLRIRVNMNWARYLDALALGASIGENLGGRRRRK